MGNEGLIRIAKDRVERSKALFKKAIEDGDLVHHSGLWYEVRDRMKAVQVLLDVPDSDRCNPRARPLIEKALRGEGISREDEQSLERSVH